MVVLTVSMGIMTMRNKAAAVDAATVLKPMLISLVASRELSMVRIPVLAAVSPKRLRGPWAKAGRTPR
jgi:hypothetical protein